MNDRNPVIGVGALAFALLGALFIVRALLAALSTGQSPGRLGAVHLSGSSEYYVYVFACLLGIAFMAVIGFLGLRWSGFLNRRG